MIFYYMKKIYIVPGSRVDKLPKLLKSITIFCKYLYHKYFRNITNPKYYSYHYDGVATRHNCSFMTSEIFVKSHARGVKAFDFESNLPFRVHQAIWATHTALHVEGDLVELGTGRGFMMSAVLESIENWEKLDRNVWLFDTFKSSILDKEGNQNNKDKFKLYAKSFEETRKNFSQWSRINLIRGKLAGSLVEKNGSTLSPYKQIDKICFLHIDLNYPETEVECLNMLWPKISQGGIVLLDDYAYFGFEKSYNLMNALSKKLDRLILTTASGQGIILK